MKLIGILFHPGKSETQAVAAELHGWLAQNGVESWVGPNGDGLPADAPLSSSDLLVVLGGDGATLRAARLAAPHGLPLFCVNMGRVGFLSEASLANWPQKLRLVLGGAYWLERRLMLRAEVFRDGQAVQELIALNDVVIGRGVQARVVRLALYVDDDHVTTYTADALIVATPTGSTAYSMAAGGPLLPPDLENFLVVPVAPHLSLSRALVLHRQAVITIAAEEGHDGMVTADGQDFVALPAGGKVVLQRHGYQATFARVGSSGYFYRRLMRRLGIVHPAQAA